MATANAMYERIAPMYAQLFPCLLDLPSLVLAHGRKNLVESFATSVIQPGHDEHDAQQPTGVLPGAAHAGWLTTTNAPCWLLRGWAP